MLTGSVPFQAETLPGIMHHHFYTPVPDVEHARLDVPVELRELIDRALAKKPENRFASTQAMLDALDTVPFPADERREGLNQLRTLARGAPIPAVGIAALPALTSSVRLTPQSEQAVTPRARWMSRPLMVTTLIAALGVFGAATVIMRRPPAAAPTLAIATPADAQPAASSLQPVVSPPPKRDSVVASRPAASPAEDPKPEPPKAVGRLRVRVFPADAEIRVDGRVLGQGVVFDSILRAGIRRLRVSAPGYQTLDTLVTIIADEITSLARITLPVQEPH
jgi:hypothetical protein